MENAHTPGPWQVNGPVTGQFQICAAGSAGYMKEICVADTCHGAPVSRVEFHANAKLIAAAPDLLSALKAVEWGGQSDDGEGTLVPVCPYCDAVEDDGHEDYCQLAAAIAKAEGTTDAKAEGIQGVRRAHEEAGQGATEAEAKVKTQET